MLCGADILDEELDEALNCLLNNYVRFRCLSIRLRHNFNRLLAEDVTFLKRLLDRGASLWFREADERSSSIAALLERVRDMEGYFSLSEFSPYICCPLFNEVGHREISIDSHRLAPLSCLAAGKIPRSQDVSEVPRELRFYIEAHRELQFQLK